MTIHTRMERLVVAFFVALLFLLTIGLFYTAVNAAPAQQAATPPKINEFVVDHVGVDSYEYVEYIGDANIDYSSRYVIVAVEGTITTSYGVVTHLFTVGSTNSAGYGTTDYQEAQFESDTITFLLLRNFSGGIGTDLDSNDDGTLDNVLWDVLVDDVAVSGGAVDDIAYSTTMLNMGGASRLPDGTDTDTAVDWTVNDFDGAGLPALNPGTPTAGEAKNSPAAENLLSTTAADPLINEFNVGNYIEILGDPNTDYSGFSVLAIEGDDSGTLGEVEGVFTLGTTNAEGYATAVPGTGYNSTTFLLVEGFSGAVGSDVDTDDNGVIDTTFWTRIIDDVAVTDDGTGTSGDLLYSAVVLYPGFDGGATIPSAASRIPNGQDTDSPSDWTRNGLADSTQAIDTPNDENAMYSPVVDLTPPLLNEFMLDYTGVGNIEFVEISGDPSENYSRYSLIAVNGDITETIGVTPTQGIIDVVLAMGSTDANGYFATTYSGDIFTRDTTTLLLVDGFTGSAGDDLDTNNDGTLDVTPWDALADDVAVTNGEASALVHSAVVLNPTYDGGTTAPGGASRLPVSTDTNTTGDWTRNDADGVYDAGEAANTAGAVNALVMPPPAFNIVINEFVIDHVGNDDYEYIEVYGDPLTDYSALTLLEIESDSGFGINPGFIDGIFPLSSTDAAGFYSTGFLPANSLGDKEFTSFGGAVTLLLVENFSGNFGDDLDTDNDGTFDITPWVSIVDDVAARNQFFGSTDYSTVLLDATGAQGAATVFSGSRLPDGVDTNTAVDWMRNDFGGAGIPALDPGSPSSGEAENTPGTTNSEATPILINEFVFNHVGADNYEYIEVTGKPNADLSTLTVLVVDGDSDGAPGEIEAAFTLGSADANGYWDTGFQAAQFGDGTAATLLVSGFTGVVGNDIDANDDGVIDNVLWTAILDDVAVADGGNSDDTYSTVVLQASTPGGSGTVGGASRLPNGTDTNTVDDWTRNDFDGAGIPALDPGTPALFEAENTRGTENTEAVPSVLPSPLINEFVFDHLGVDTEEYIEIAGSLNSEYSRYSLLAIEGAITPTVEITPLQGIITRVYGIGTTNGEGTHNIELDTDEFNFDTVTLLLVEDFVGALGDDIDTDNDGAIDTVLWTNIADDVALTNGNPANTTYSAVVLDNTFGTGGSTPRGASRIPNATDTDAVGDWTENDFDGFGLPGFTGSPSPTEANNTPEAVNTIPSATAPEWLGYNDSWNAPTNWSAGAVPTSLDDVLIPAAPVGGSMPVLDVNAAVDTLDIEAGASLDLATFTLTAESGISNEGTLIQTQPATAVNTPVTFLNIQNIAGDTDHYFGVIITPTAASMGNVTVRVEGNQPYCGSELATLLSRCFEIVPQSVQSADIRFYYEQAEQNGQPANDLRLWLFGSSPWVNGSSTDTYTYSEAGTSCASAYCSFTADEVTQYGRMTGGVYNIFVWLGYTADWNTPSNWSIGSVPTLSDTVIISGTAVGGNMPILNGPANVDDLTLENGASIDLNGFTFTVQGNLDNGGMFTVGNGTLVVNGDFSNSGIMNLGDSATVTVEGTFNNYGTLSQTRPVNAGTVEFIHIRNAAGTVLKYEGVIITSAANMGNVFVSTRYGRCTDNEADLLTQRCFEITPDTPQSATVRFVIDSNEFNGLNLLASGVAWHYDGPPGIWSDASSTATYTRGATVTGNYVEAADVTAYSPFAVGLSASTPTAVTLNTIQTNTTHPFWLIAVVGLLIVLLITVIKIRFLPVHPTK